MVCWASPNEDSPKQSERRGEAIENIQQLNENKPLVASLEAAQKSLKSSSGGLSCIEGSIYKVPFLKIGADGESRGQSAAEPPTAKRRKTAATTKGKGISTKGKGGAAKGKAPEFDGAPDDVASISDDASEEIVSLLSYPPSDTALNKLKKAATVVVVESADSSERSASEPSTSMGSKGTRGKKGSSTAGLIDGERIAIDNEEEWLQKGMKTPMDKILKTIVDQAIDPKTVVANLVRIQLIGKEGLAPQTEDSPENHIGTFLVVLPLKFKGGKISVRHGDETSSIDPAKSKSTVRCSWIAFKAEAEYWVEAVTEDTTEALLVYHIIGDRKKGANQADNGEKTILDKLDAVAKQITPNSRINRVGVLLNNKYNPKNFLASSLKGHDRWLFNLLKDSKYEVKLTFVRVLMTSWGFYDSRDWDQPEKRVQMTDCGEFMESEIWEMDMSKAEKWAPRKWNDKGDSSPMYAVGEEHHHKCRRLPWEMPWLHKSLLSAISQMTRVDREPLPSWSEGLWLCETYRAAALLITVKPGFADADDGPYTHFYPVAHPEPRGVSEREDMEWSRPVLVWRLPGETQEESDEIDRKFWARRNWVHDDLD